MDEPHNTKPSPPFHNLVTFFERLSNLSGVGIRDRRHELINGFISKWREQAGPDIYPAFQLILPHLDSENSRKLYNIKEHKFGKLLVTAMNLNKNSADAKQLLEFRSTKGKSAGNFPEIAFKIIDKRDTNLEYSGCTVDDILKYLDELSVAKFDDQVRILQQMIMKMNAIELKWIVRIILHSMHLHVSEHTFFHCWHPDAQALFNVTNDLKIVCHQLWDTSIRLQAKDQEIKPGSCFKPQRSKFRKKAMEQFKAVVEDMPDSGFYIEEKMDGERMQIHWCDSGKSVKYFSRRGKDYTSLYGNSKNANNGSLSLYIGEYINPKVKTCVLDGEMVAYDLKNSEICPLNKVKQAAVGDETGQWNPLFMAFDIVHLNGRDLSDVALKERKRALELVLPRENRERAMGRFQILPYMLAHTEDQVRIEFERVISQLSEGLIIKNPLSKYTVDGFNDAWIKVKPEFMSGYESENFDLLAIGGYYGRGKRGSILASFLCALRSDDNEYYTVCKVGNGICMAMYDKIRHLTEGKWIDFDENNIPENYHILPEKPHVIIKPENALVLEVKATQIWPAEKFSCGHSLRFPRFVSLREDRSYEDSLTLSQFLTVNEEQNPAEKKKRQQVAQPKSRTKKVKFQYENSNEDESKKQVLVESMLFDGLLFYVPGDIDDPQYMLVPEVQSLLKQHGGRITRNVDDSNAIIISDKEAPRIFPLIKANSRDIIHPRWIFDCIKNARALDYEPDQFLSARPESMEAALQRVDDTGLSFEREYRLDDIPRKLETLDTPLCTEEQLQYALGYLMQQGGDIYDTRGLMFWQVVVYFDPEMDPRLIKELQYYIRFGSGHVTIVKDADATTHVICDDKSRKALYAKHRGPFIVPSKWIFESWNNETRVDELKGIDDIDGIIS